MKRIVLFAVMSLTLAFSHFAAATDASQFEDLVGYTVLTVTHASGEVEGVDFDKLIKMDNGMIFEFHSYSYFYAYHPDVAVFSKDVVFQGKSITLYKVIIGDENETFDVSRIR
jgi:ABC-type multidrug transport system ATPase subunit